MVQLRLNCALTLLERPEPSPAISPLLQDAMRARPPCMYSPSSGALAGRHGALTGNSKHRVDVKYGEDPLFLKWRREYDVKPPPI
jgi:bisphosphoglycerate-dependent phosphoglycerate mutase